MKRLGTIIRQWPFHLVLMPLYFISHISLRFSGMLDRRETMIAFLEIVAALAIAFFLFSWIYNRSKAALLVTVLGSLYLFFGDIKYTFSGFPVLGYIAHYKVLLPLLLILVIILFYKIGKIKSPGNAHAFLTILFLLYLGIDMFERISPQKRKLDNLEKTQVIDEKRIPPGDLPSIYYILADCYPGIGYQHDVLGMTDNYLDSALGSKGFYLVKNSRSNYNNTAFSMASVFAMNYLSGLDSVNNMAPYFYNRAIRVVKKSPFMGLIEKSGYSIRNFSVFDLAGTSAMRKDNFLSISTTHIIFYNTLADCIKRDLYWQLKPGYLARQQKKEKDELRKWLTHQKNYNQQVLDTLAAFKAPSNQRVFLYAHLLLPHFPYFYDAAGSPNPDETVFGDSMITSKKNFAGYISYTNHKLTELVTRLIENTGGRAVIIVQSDHGITDIPGSKKDDAFRNFSAFYFPGKEYHLLYEGMSNVNSFRVLLDQYFGQTLPLLPDRSIFLK